jgi:signal transduction histidine kinase
MLLDRGEVFVSPFDLNVEHEAIEKPLKPVIRFATPVFDRNSGKRGVLVLNYLGAALINKLIEVSINFPGTVFLLNKQGYFLHGPKPEDEWGFMFDKQRTIAADFPEEWPRLADTDGQWLTGHGLFTSRTLTPRRPLPAHRQVRSAGSAGDRDADDPSLRVVSYIPTETIQGRANQLLRRILLLYGVVVVLVLVLAWYLAYAGALRRNQELHLAESESRLRTLSSRLITAQEDERRSLSRDLHDELGQLVTAVTLDLQRAAPCSDPGKKNELIGRALTSAAYLLDHIHEISTRVRPTILDDLGLKDAVQSCLSEYESRTGIVTRAELRFTNQNIPPVVSENVYRILQEALTNVSKHAQAVEVFVELEVDTASVALTVRDSGKGFTLDALDGKRLGILGMRERAELLDGSFSATSEPGKGTEIRVVLPLAAG